jgi:peptidoglycan L-alanyl-D-glutamate endopeptidase CwlK
MSQFPLTMLEITDLRSVYVAAFQKAATDAEKEVWRGRIRDLHQQEALLVIEESRTAALQLLQVVSKLDQEIARLQDPAILVRFQDVRRRIRSANGVEDVDGTHYGLVPNDTGPGPVMGAGPKLSEAPTEPVHSAAADAVEKVDPEVVDKDLSKLHPTVRAKVLAVQGRLDGEGIPMRVFEAYRAPERQAFLYAKGRTAPGSKVTNAKAWESYHQYGLAADFVRFENGRPNWDTDTPQKRDQWARYHAIAKEEGLEPLSWELPHVQLIGTSFARLLSGDYPDNGDETWNAALSASIKRWTGSPKPPLPDQGTRPPHPSIPLPSVTASSASAGWHNRFGGDSWHYDRNGVYTRNPDGSAKLWRTSGSPITVQEVVSRFGAIIGDASRRFNVEPALIIMTIATETSQYRADGFTGIRTFRWEPNATLNYTGDPALDRIQLGDYSAGPMQVLSSTARWLNATMNLGFDPGTAFPWYKNKPPTPSSTLGLMDPTICIHLGTAYIAHELSVTGGDPLLVAAAYNAGSIKPSSENAWRIHSYGNHIDRAAEWYGDACAVLNQTA